MNFKRPCIQYNVSPFKKVLFNAGAKQSGPLYCFSKKPKNMQRGKGGRWNSKESMAIQKLNTCPWREVNLKPLSFPALARAEPSHADIPCYFHSNIAPTL